MDLKNNGEIKIQLLPTTRKDCFVFSSHHSLNFEKPEFSVLITTSATGNHFEEKTGFLSYLKF
jgi:hypothetical protein